MRIITLFFTLAVLLSGTTMQAQKPQLKVSENKHYLVDQNGKPVFWLGDTGWLLFVKTTREEAEKYLEDRRQKGFNVIQVMVVHNVNSGVNVYGDSALVEHDLSRPNITPGNSFSDKKQYDFWDNVDYIVDLAASKGLYMAMVPIWGTNVKAGQVSRTQAKTYAEFLAKRYKDKWNIVWMNGGDVKGSDSTKIWKIIGRTLRANDPNHLITYHPFGRHTSSIWFHNEQWLDFNMFQSGHRHYSQDTVPDEQHFGPDSWKYPLHDLALTPVKPCLDGEPSYEQIPWGLHDTLAPYWTADDVRRYAYWSVFGGGCGFTYGHNAVMQFFQPSDNGNSAYGAKSFWTSAINDPGAGQMIHLKKLMLSKSYLGRIPDQSVIFGDPGWRYDFIVATRGEHYVMVYTYTGRNFRLNMGKIAGKTVNASWYSPRDGKYTVIGEISNDGIASFDPPGEKAEGNDWVLVLDGKTK
jgi:hypothetical protein